MSREEQVAAEMSRQTVEALWDAARRRPGAVYNRVLGVVSTGWRDWPVDVTIYPLLWGRFRVCVGPCAWEDDGGFDWKQDVDSFEEAHALAERITLRDAQMIRAGSKGHRVD